MAEYHLDRTALEAFSRGSLPAAEALRVEEHLRSGCPDCQRRVDEILRAFAELSVREVPAVAGAAARSFRKVAGDQIFAGLDQRLLLVSLERGVAPSLAAELLAASPAQRAELLRTQSRFCSLPVCELFIEQSFAVGFEDSARAAELAELALLLADHLDAGYYGKAVVQDLRARAWAHLGNARRIGSDLNGAEQALRRAEALLDEGSADPLDEARVLDFKVSLLSDQGWFEQAADLLNAVISIYEDVQDQHRKGRALISQGLVLSYAGRPAQAVTCLTDGLAAIDWAAEPRLALMARHNLAWSLNDCGRSEEARRLLERFREEYHGFHDAWTELRLRWLESRIALRLGHEEEAEQGLCEVRARFLEKDVYGSTLVMLDLASLYLRQGKGDAVRRLAAETLPEVPQALAQTSQTAQTVHAQAAVALSAFRQAAETGSVTPGLLQEIASYLQRARKNPELRFRASG